MDAESMIVAANHSGNPRPESTTRKLVTPRSFCPLPLLEPLAVCSWRIPVLHLGGILRSPQLSVGSGLDFQLSLVTRRSLHFEIRVDSEPGIDVKHLRMSISLETMGSPHVRRPFQPSVEGVARLDSVMWGSLRGISTVSLMVLVRIFEVKKYRQPNFVEIPADSSKGSLSSDLAAAFDKETNADMTIICEGSSHKRRKRSTDREKPRNQLPVMIPRVMQQSAPDLDMTSPSDTESTFRVQSGILTSRSKVFEAMFARDFVEGSPRVLRIADMTPGALKEFLRFLYSDRVRDIEKYGRELLNAAEKYEVRRLRELCEQALCQDLDDDKVVLVGLLAHERRLEKAMEFTVEAIAANFEDVSKREVWKAVGQTCPEMKKKVVERVGGSRIKKTKKKVRMVMST